MNSHSYTYILKPPARCTPAEIRNFTALVKAGDEANLTVLDDGIRRAYYLGFCIHDSELVGVAALKHSDLGHQNDVFTRAQIPRLARTYHTELGLVSTKKEYRGRGIASTLGRRLIEKTPAPVFASARCRNTTAINILIRLGFYPIGHRFRGRHHPEKIYYVQLFTRKP